MIIGPSLIIIIFCNLLVSSLVTSSTVNIEKSYHHDDKAYDYGIAGSSVGFGGIGILIGLLLFSRMYGLPNVYLYSLLWMWVILIVLAAMSYLSYKKLVDSKHYPIGAKNNSNDVEEKIMFAAFCMSLVGISVGITYVITSGIHEGYFDMLTGNVFGFRDLINFLFGEESKHKGTMEQIELDDLISDLKESSF